MQEPEFPEGFSPSLGPPKRKRQQRTMYSAEQRQELEEFFASKLYPTYEEREALAAKLNLQENQVQLWFKNRRAKHNRLLGLTKKKGRGARAAPQGPGVCTSAPPPAPAGLVFPEDPVLPVGPVFSGDPIRLAGPVFPEDPVFSGDPVFPGVPALSEDTGFCSATPPSALGVVPAAEPGVSSHSQARWDPAQGAQTMVPVVPAPAPAPVWPRGSYTSNLSPDPLVTTGFTELLEGPSSSFSSDYQEGDDSVSADNSSSKMLLIL
ncbi:tetrapeptide repeat homeobox protein 2-like [Saccopteryx bilineata]|uniref:tetrapeptide repeat homeobox protein 2-like n=1 Tax=Saccopteryx bilineata TaxID=59482 RepID=UPI00338D4A85